MVGTARDRLEAGAGTEGRETEVADAAGHTDATAGKKTTTETPGSG